MLFWRPPRPDFEIHPGLVARLALAVDVRHGLEDVVWPDELAHGCSVDVGGKGQGWCVRVRSKKAKMTSRQLDFNLGTSHSFPVTVPSAIGRRSRLSHTLAYSVNEGWWRAMYASHPFTHD